MVARHSSPKPSVVVRECWSRPSLSWNRPVSPQYSILAAAQNARTSASRSLSRSWRAAGQSTTASLCHLHHRIERALGGSGIGIADRLCQRQRRNLPGQTPFVLAPAAHTRFAAVPDDRIPVPIRFGLVSGCDLERECFVVLELGAAIKRELLRSEYGIATARGPLTSGGGGSAGPIRFAASYSHKQSSPACW
jgi:hypothetical protein